MKLILKAIALLFVGFLSVQAQTESSGHDYSIVNEYEIGGLEVSGTEFLDVNVIKTLSGLRVGDNISLPGEEIPKALKNLWTQGLFADVKIVSTKTINEIIFLEIQLRELPRLSRYKFNGIRKSEIEDLREELGLISGKIVNSNLKNKSEYKIRNYYLEKGFLNVHVGLNEQKDTLRANNVILEFDIKRGNKIKISQIAIHGNEHISSRQIKRSMKETKEKAHIDKKVFRTIRSDIKDRKLFNVLGNISVNDALNYIDDKARFSLFSSSKYQENLFEADQETIIAKYMSMGYRDARIINDTAYLIDDANVRIDMTIDEGNQYYFRGLEWVGNTKYTTDELNRVLRIKKGDIYDSDRLQQRLFMDPESADISSLYMDDGYLFFNVTPVEKRVEGDSIDLEIRVTEGPQATINNIIIRGNDKTNEHVIRRELRTIPGSKFRRSDIIRSQREIAALGYFNPETIGINPIPNPQDGTVDIEYVVEEQSSDQLELSAGWGGQSIVGSAGVSFNNFSVKNMFKPDKWRPYPAGDGQRLSFRFQSTGKPIQSYSASFTEPWLGGKKPHSFTVATSFSKYRQSPGLDNFETDALTSTLKNWSNTISLGRRLKWPDDNFSLINSLTYSYFFLERWTDGFIVNDGAFHNISFENTLVRTTIDAPLYPRRGSLFQLSFEFTPPYSAFNNKDYKDLEPAEAFKFPEYFKTKFKAEWYTPIKGDLVLKLSAKMGFLGYYNSDIGYAPFERFEVGGDGLSSGFFNQVYGKDIISLRGYEVFTSNVQNGSSVGDPIFSKYTAEIRYPFSLNPTSTIYALAFAEAGNSWGNFGDFNPFNLRRSVGVGIRIFLPMFGLIGFDYAIGFDKNLTPASDSVSDYLNTYGKPTFMLGFEPE